jgi:hypothetical protein
MAGRTSPRQSVRHRSGAVLGLFFRFFSEIDCDTLEVSVGMRAPIMPHT